jgi:hypothetical protein
MMSCWFSRFAKAVVLVNVVPRHRGNGVKKKDIYMSLFSDTQERVVFKYQKSLSRPLSSIGNSGIWVMARRNE